MTPKPTPSLTSLTVKQLVDVLKDLKGGSIGFDPFRDDRTNSKPKLLSFIATHFDDAAIIQAVLKQTASATSTTPTPQQPVTPPDMPKVPAPLQAPSNDDAAQLAALLARMAGSQTVNADQVRALVEQQTQGLLKTVEAMLANVSAPTRVIVEAPNLPAPVDMGIQHEQFPNLLKACNARTADGHRLNIWLWGPASSGKTTAAEKVAQALGLDFSFNGAIETKYDLIGFVDAGGRYHETQFYKRFKNGGVHLFDEIDGSNPAAVKSFNAATANGIFCFPNGEIVRRHKDCVLIAGANTAGNGATTDYNAAFKQDESVKSRYAYLHWPLDEKLERALAVNPDWCAHVQKLRLKASERRIKGNTITTRATFYGAALLAAGIDQKTVEAMVIRKDMSDDTWKELTCR